VSRSSLVLVLAVVAALVAGFVAGMAVHGGWRLTVTRTSTVTYTVHHTTTITGGAAHTPTSTSTNTHAASTHTTTSLAGAAGFSTVPEEYREAYRLAVRLMEALEKLPPEIRRVVSPKLTSIPAILPVLPRSWITITAATAPIPLAQRVSELVSGYNVVKEAAPGYVVSTNVQVSGIDEPDIVKTNGTHIFIEKGDGTIIVARIYPVESMREILTINATRIISRLVGPAELLLKTGNTTLPLAKARPRIHPRGLLVDDRGDIVALYDVAFEAGYALRRWIPSPANIIGALLLRPTTWVLVFSPNGRLLYHSWINGWLVDARLEGHKLVVVTRFTREFWWSKPLHPAPGWTSWGRIPLTATAILGFPTASTTIVSVFNTHNWTRCAISLAGPAPRMIYMTRSGDVYVFMSPATLHIVDVIEKLLEAIEKTPAARLPLVVERIMAKVPRITPWTTLVVHISTAKWRPMIVSRRVVEGTPTTQFAVDVYRGYLRLALQRGWGNGFNLYILNATTLSQVANMTVPMRLERVHAVRFIGDRLYIVTYRTRDPLFVIDLSNPREPRILGYREGPGFDEYLHPLNETSLIGLGIGKNGELRLSTYLIKPDGSVVRVSVVRLPDKWSIVFTRYGYHAFILDEKHHLVMFPGEIRHIPVEVNGRRSVITTGRFYVVPYNPLNLTLGEPRVISGGVLRGVVVDDVLYTVSSIRLTAYSLPGLKPLKAVDLH